MIETTDDSAANALPIGTRIGECEIEALIGFGPCSLVYLAEDRSLGHRVAIKEYMPASLASRVDRSCRLVVKHDPGEHDPWEPRTSHQEAFEAGLRSFVDAARLFAGLDHPALLKVHRFWEENGTAYMAMRHYQDPTLKQALTAMSAAPEETTLRAWLRRLMDALEAVHGVQGLHGEVVPDNILMTESGPLLLDSGAARRTIAAMTPGPRMVPRFGFAPCEHHIDELSGPWTDLYALASVVYFAITGQTPIAGVGRMMRDELEPLSRIAAGRYSSRFLGAIDVAMAVHPEHRPQSIGRFRDLLDAPGALPVASASTR